MKKILIISLCLLLLSGTLIAISRSNTLWGNKLRRVFEKETESETVIEETTQQSGLVVVEDTDTGWGPIHPVDGWTKFY